MPRAQSVEIDVRDVLLTDSRTRSAWSGAVTGPAVLTLIRHRY